MKKYLLALGLIALPVIPMTLGGCMTTSEGHGLEGLEEMSEADYQRLKLYSTLGIKIAVNRLVEDGTITTEDIGLAIDVLDSIKSTPIQGGAELVVKDLLQDSGLTNTEIEALVEIVVFELEARGAFDNLDVNNMIVLAPRTEDLINSFIDAVRSVSE